MSDVTVVMTVYNGMPYLPAAVQSVFDQSLRDFKFIIVNDGSTDGTVEYLAGLNDPRLLVLHQANQGTSLAANHGLAHCDTPFFARLDSDDIATPTRLEEQRTFLLNHPEVGAVGAQVAPLGDHGAGGNLRLPLDHDAIYHALLTGRHAIVNSVIMSRTALIKELRGHWSLPAGEDWDLYLRMGEVSKLANLDQVMLLWRVHERSLTGSGLRHVRFCVKYACDSARRRQAGLPPISVDEFRAQCDASPWWVRTADALDIHARVQYRTALAELYGRHRIRGAVRLTWAALCAPRLTIERIGRVLHWRPASSAAADG